MSIEDSKPDPLASYGVKSPEEKQKDLAMEEQLWQQVMTDPEKAEFHNIYIGHVIRSGLLKEGSRRYGPIVDDKEKYSIEVRRLARYYQKQIVNLMFMTPTSKNLPKKKSGGLAFIGVFIAMSGFFIGLFNLRFWYLMPVSLTYLVPFIYLKIKQFREISERSQEKTDLHNNF